MRGINAAQGKQARQQTVGYEVLLLASSGLLGTILRNRRARPALEWEQYQWYKGERERKYTVSPTDLGH